MLQSRIIQLIRFLLNGTLLEFLITATLPAGYILGCSLVVFSLCFHFHSKLPPTVYSYSLNCITQYCKSRDDLRAVRIIDSGDLRIIHFCFPCLVFVLMNVYFY